MKKRIIGVFLTMIMVAGLIPNAYAASEIELIDKLSAYTNEPIVNTKYADFNGDGYSEMIAITGTANRNDGFPNTVDGKVWLVSDDGVFPVNTEPKGYGYILSDDFKPKYLKIGNITLLQYNAISGNNNVYSYICAVKDSKTSVAYSFDGYLQEKDGEYVVTISDYDIESGRYSHDYWYYFDEDSLSFREYGAIDITKEQLLKYNGADEILAGIDGDVENIFYRGNGIININVSKKYDDDYSFDTNILVGYDSSRVWKIDRNDGIYQSSIGHYQNMLHPFIADYPVFEPERIKVKLNGKEIEFDQQPIMAEGNRVMVPIRAIFETLGYTLEWDQITETATATNGTDKLVVKVGLSGVHFNDEWIPFDVPNTNESGRVRVPVRVVSECAGAKVDWDGDTRTVILEK